MKKNMVVAFLAALLSSSFQAVGQDKVPLNMGLRVATLRYAEVGVPLSADGNGCMPVFAGGKLGFVDLQGKEIMAPTYNKDREALDYFFSNHRMRVLKEGKFGFIDTQLKEVIPCQYEAAGDFVNGCAKVKESGRWGFVNPDGSKVSPAIYKRVVDFSHGMAAVVGENDSLGFINKKGELVIPCRFENREDPKFEGYPSSCSVYLDGRRLLINEQGEDMSDTDAPVLMTEKYDSSPYWTEMSERVNQRVSYELAATPYDEISYLARNYLMVMKKKDVKRYGVLLYNVTNSQEVIPCEFDNVSGPYCGGPVDYFVVEKSGKYGAYTIDGKELLPCVYQMIGHEGLKYILVERDDLFGFVDGTGKEVVPCQFSDARPFNAAMTAVEVSKKDKKVWNFIDKTGKVVFTPEFDDVMTFQNGVCPVKRKGAWGFINETGKIIIPFKYEYSFSDDNERWSYAKSKVGDPIPVSKEGKFGFVDLSGKTIIKFVFDDASAFNSVTRQAKVQMQGKNLYIDGKGNLVEQITEEEVRREAVHREIQVEKVDGKYAVFKDGVPFATYLDEVKPFARKSDRYTPVKIVNKWGLMNGNGEIVVPCIYDAIDVKGPVIIVRVLSKKGLIDRQGNSVLSTDEKKQKVEWLPLVNVIPKIELRGDE